MKKKQFKKFGSTYYLLGADSEGTRYYLKEFCFDCEWYFAGGYVETFTNSKNPERSRDIKSHNHFDSMFFNGRVNGFDAFKKFFAETPFTDSEIWKVCELMKSFYICRHYSDMLYCGGAHYTSNPAKESIVCPDEYKRINEKVIPAIADELYKIVGGYENE